MTSNSQRTKTREAEFETISEVVVKKRRGFSLVWLIPLVALLIGGLAGLQDCQ